MKFRKKPVVIEATQWFANGDHPEDGDETFVDSAGKMQPCEGKVVRYFRRPEPAYRGEVLCPECSVRLHEHGFIDTMEGGRPVCPGDWIITGIRGERYPCNPAIFAVTYDSVSDEKGDP